jgi:predicted AlkP superfamily phosphohydrolase/phosphomutase
MTGHLDGQRGCGKRVFIIGLDGATWDVLRPLMDRGHMPRLKQFCAEGTSGTLWSTVPPITPAAWTTFMTGKSPGTHGIIDFERYDVRTNRLTLNTTSCLGDVRTLWQILGDKGLRVGCISIPMTYPPTPVNGFLVSGLGTPNRDSNFTWPAELKEDVLRLCPDYGFGERWQRRALGGRAVFAENLEAICRSFHHGETLARELGDRHGWDVLMVVLKLVDNLQHKTWKHIDPRWTHRDPKRTEAVVRCFAELDTVFGNMVEYADRNQATVFVMSDHGHGSLEGQAQPNWLLQQWGFLAIHSAAEAANRGLGWLRRMRKRRRGAFAGGGFSIEHDLAVDLSATQACVMHAGMAGFLYLNLAGRQETGIVPPERYEALRDELRERFLDVTDRDPSGRTIRVFRDVHKPEELYGCTRADREWLPDLLLVPHESLAVVRKIRTSAPVRWLPWRRLEGTHRDNGIFAARGPGIARGRTLDAHIIDSTPTVLAMLGLPVPDDMEGRVMEGAFDPPVSITREAAAAAVGVPTGEAYTEEDQRKITERLMDLGYLQ